MAVNQPSSLLNIHAGASCFGMSARESRFGPTQPCGPDQEYRLRTPFEDSPKPKCGSTKAATFLGLDGLCFKSGCLLSGFREASSNLRLVFGCKQIVLFLFFNRLVASCS